MNGYPPIQIHPTPRDNLMSETMSFIEDARKSFRLASTAQGEHEMKRYAAMGGDYIKLAHDAGKLKDQKELPGLWRTH